MSLIISLCEDPCPICTGLVCCEAAHHKPPHRTVLIGSGDGRPRERIVIEWRAARDDEHWSQPNP